MNFFRFAIAIPVCVFMAIVTLFGVLFGEFWSVRLLRLRRYANWYLTLAGGAQGPLNDI